MWGCAAGCSEASLEIGAQLWMSHVHAEGQVLPRLRSRKVPVGISDTWLKSSDRNLLGNVAGCKSWAYALQWFTMVQVVRKMVEGVLTDKRLLSSSVE